MISGSVPEPMEQAALKTGMTVSPVFNAVLLCPILWRQFDIPWVSSHSGFTNIGNQDKQLHHAVYQLTKLTQGLPSMLKSKGWCWQHLTNLKGMDHMILLPKKKIPVSATYSLSDEIVIKISKKHSNIKSVATHSLNLCISKIIFIYSLYTCYWPGANEPY